MNSWKFEHLNSEDLIDVTDDIWLANRTSFRVRSVQMEVRLIVANQNRTQIHAIVYKQKPSLYFSNHKADNELASFQLYCAMLDTIEMNASSLTGG